MKDSASSTKLGVGMNDLIFFLAICSIDYILIWVRRSRCTWHEVMFVVCWNSSPGVLLDLNFQTSKPQLVYTYVSTIDFRQVVVAWWQQSVFHVTRYLLHDKKFSIAVPRAREKVTPEIVVCTLVVIDEINVTHLVSRVDASRGEPC